MTKYEPQSYSKRDMDGKKISWALVVSNSGFFAAPSGKELRGDQTLWAHKSKWAFVLKDVRNATNLLGIFSRWGRGW